MRENDRMALEAQEKSDLVAREAPDGGYAFVRRRRPKQEAAPTLPSPSARGTGDFPARAAAYRDPELCACPSMQRALAGGIVMVVWAGPVALAPAVLDERALLSGAIALDAVERAYDGRPWAFRFCPFEGRLIDDQVAILPQVERMTCCGVMALAVEHGRVELPDPARHDRTSAKFVHHARPSIRFSWCPWCATEIIDLVLARHKRHRGL